MNILNALVAVILTIGGGLVAALVLGVIGFMMFLLVSIASIAIDTLVL